MASSGPRDGVRIAFAVRQIAGALFHRPAPRLLGLAALALAATLVTMLAAFDRVAPSAVEATLARSGPNVTIAPAPGVPYLSEDALARVDRALAARQVPARARVLVGSVHAVGDSGRSIRVPVLGGDAAIASVYPAWALTGAWPAAGGRSCLLGEQARRTLGVSPGALLTVEGPGGSEQLQVAGLLHTGGAEDDAVVTDLSTAGALLGVPGRASAVALRAPGGATQVEELARALGRAAPDVDARVVRRVTQADERVLALVRLLLRLGTGTILACAVLALSATLVTLVSEREREIALLRALGAESVRVTALFAGEASLVALAAGVLGYVAGSILAAALGKSLLGLAVAAPPALLAVSIVVTLVLAAAAGAWPLARALRVRPAAALRGE